MRVIRQRQVGGVLGVCLLTVLVLRQGGRWSPAPPPRRSMMPPFRAAARGPFDQALSEAKRWRFRAQTRVTDQVNALDAWDPDPRSDRMAEAYGEELLARAPELDCARQAATHAVALARNRTEAAQALQMLALIECESGHHQAELQPARQLVALSPHNEIALFWLRRAARSNHLEALVRQASAELASLMPAPRPAPSREGIVSSRGK